MLSDLYILEPETMRWSRPTTIGKSPIGRAGHSCTAIGPAPQAQSERTAALQNAMKSSDESSPRRTEEDNFSSPRSGSSYLPLASNNSSVNGGHASEDAAAGSQESNAVNVSPPSQRLLFFGGGDNDGFMNDLHLLEIDTLTWSPVFTAGSSPSPRSRHSATLVKSTLWVIGGLGEGQNVFNDVYTLNTTSMVWSKPALKGNPMTPRWGHSAIRSGSLIIIFGGHNGAAHPDVDVYNDLHVLDTDSGIWRTVENGALTLSLPPPVPLPTLELTPVAEIEGESTSPTSVGSTNSSFSNSTNNSSTGASHGNHMNVNGHSHTNTTATAPIPVIVAGSSASNLNAVSGLPSMNGSPHTPAMPSVPPSPRCGHSANFVLLGRERKMVIFGGSNTAGDVFNDTYVLDLDTYQWSNLNIQGSLPQARSVHSCNTVEDKLFVIGGIDSNRRFKDIYTLSLSTVVHPTEDPSMVPLRSSGRPRRSSRASPRVHSVASPTSTPHNISNGNGLNSPNGHSNAVGGTNSNSLPATSTATLATATLNQAALVAPASPTSTQHAQAAAGGASNAPNPIILHPAHLVHTPSGPYYAMPQAAQPVTPNTPIASASTVGNATFAASPFPHPLQVRRSNEELVRSSDGASLPNGGVLPLSVHIPSQGFESIDDGRLSPLMAHSPLNSFSSPMRQRPTSSNSGGLRRSGNGTVSPASLSSAHSSASVPSGLQVTPGHPESPHQLQNSQYDALPQMRYNRSANSSMESLPPLSPMAVFLSGLGLSRLISKFEAEEIDMSVLPYLTEENMEYLGVNTLGARLRLANAIQALRVSPPASKSASMTQGLANPTSLGNTTPHQTAMEPLESAVERLVSTVLVATNTLTETMHFITTKITNVQAPTSTSPQHQKTNPS